MKTIELFSGAGGMALGLNQAGFESTAFFEWNMQACQALRHNRPAWHIVNSDVRHVDFTEFQGVDLVAGGPPCQPFSMGGKARGYDDTRDMFPQAVRAVREIQPSAFLFENVRGLMRPGFSNYVEFIRLQLTYPDFPVSQNVDWETNLHRLQAHHSSERRTDGLTYQVSIHQADAADYGVPQRRHRVFFIGFRSDLAVGWSFPKPTHSQDALIRTQFVDGSYCDHHGIAPLEPTPRLMKRVERVRNPDFLDTTLPWRTVRDAFRDLPDPRTQKDIPNHVYQPGARTYPGHTGSLLDEPSKALKAGDHGVPGGENMLRYPNGKVRYFTVRESARIQTFPDDFIFPGSWTESMRQLGNAVPVELARVVAASIAAKIPAFLAKKA
ncbi:MAG: DNA cytosine methyltransferase [Verrucomicrobia bacterium]|nr:DNA cytosine methyltransferase [Verrucomicrobiota bacterium]MCH8514409.1 DNA cytosine methyltransferase [Kiritimatiellia bacterium]